MRRIFSLTTLFVSLTISGQVAINTTSTATDASAMLHITCTIKGLLIPCMTYTERNTIVNPKKRLLVFDITFNQLYFYNGSGWVVSNF